MQFIDAGGNVKDQADQLGLEIGEDYMLPHPRTMQNGVDIEILNQIYNCSDMIISTTHGEGWGLSITEGFATKTPVVCPANTSMIEIGADNRAILIPSGQTPEAWVVKQDDNDIIRPIVSVDKMARAIIEYRAGTSQVDVDKAYAFAQKYSWNNVCKDWVKLFITAGTAAQDENQKRQEAQKTKEFQKHKSKKARKRERANRKASRK
jgi:glycosyltransferase involved in cell wall biosynthesis